MNAREDGIELIQAEQLRLLHAGMPASIVSGTMLAALLAYAQRSVIDSAVIVAWFSLIAAIDGPIPHVPGQNMRAQSVSIS